MVNASSAYSTLKLAGGVAYVKEGVDKDLERVDAIIFDCDGVLIDARRSYDRTIKKTVAYIFRYLTGTPLPKGVVTSRVIYRFRSTGGFNSDWDNTYAVLMGIFAQLPQPFVKAFQAAYDRRSGKNWDDPAQRLASVRRWVSGKIFDSQLGEIEETGEDELLKMASKSDSTGIKSVESILFNSVVMSKDVVDGLKAFKSFLHYPGSVKESVISRVFDEFFYGSEFFREVHCLRPVFNKGQGFMSEERVIVGKETLSQLAENVGRKNLAIASGRGSKSTKKTLQGLTEFMNPKAMVFLEDEELYMNPTEDERAQLGKPQPYSLLKVKELLPRFTKAVYVGDSSEDLLMAQRANKIDDRFLFAGIYSTGYSPSERLKFFRSQGADVLIASVNDLPQLLRSYNG